MQKYDNLWMKDRNFDLGLFHLSGLAALLFLIPYGVWGAVSVLPIYNVYLIFFGLPHNYLTWATIFPKSSRPSFRMDKVYTAAFVCGIIAILIPLSRGLDLNDWILSFISYYSLWHAYRQHHGICKIYDSIQSRRYNDKSIFADSKWLSLFFGLAANAVVIWAFTHKQINYLLSSEESYRLIYPQIPMAFFFVYCAATAVVGVLGLKHAVYDRWRSGKFIPWPQLSLMTIAIMTYTLPYFIIPIDAMPLAVAIATIYHNIQYFGFVWLYEKYHSRELEQEGAFLHISSRLALNGAWKRYFGLALSYSFLVIGFYLISPRQVGLTFIYFLGISHYIIDGYIWRRDHNVRLSGFINYLSGAKDSVLATIPFSSPRPQANVSRNVETVERGLH